MNNCKLKVSSDSILSNFLTCVRRHSNCTCSNPCCPFNNISLNHVVQLTSESCIKRGRARGKELRPFRHAHIIQYHSIYNNSCQQQWNEASKLSEGGPKHRWNWLIIQHQQFFPMNRLRTHQSATRKMNSKWTHCGCYPFLPLLFSLYWSKALGGVLKKREIRDGNPAIFLCLDEKKSKPKKCGREKDGAKEWNSHTNSTSYRFFTFLRRVGEHLHAVSLIEREKVLFDEFFLRFHSSVELMFTFFVHSTTRSHMLINHSAVWIYPILSAMVHLVNLNADKIIHSLKLRCERSIQDIQQNLNV